MNVDDFIAQQFPVHPVPSNGCITPTASDGVRYHVASNGLWREISLSWLHCMLPVATQEGLRIPYGLPRLAAELRLPVPGRSIWREFVELAKAAMPNECAGLIVWNVDTQSWRFETRRALSATSEFISYEEPHLGASDIKVVDLHSHGQHPAFFSPTDDQDDVGSIKLSVVFGNIDGDVTMASRLSLIDRFVDVFIDAESWGVRL